MRMELKAKEYKVFENVKITWDDGSKYWSAKQWS